MYDSKHGKVEDKGQALSDISGQGKLPCGTHTVNVVSAVYDDGANVTTIVMDEPARGLHVEELRGKLPEGLPLNKPIKAIIGLSEGVYARRNHLGELALFDATTQKKMTPWTKNIAQFFTAKTVLACPILSELHYSDVVWKPDVVIVKGK